MLENGWRLCLGVAGRLLFVAVLLSLGAAGAAAQPVGEVTRLVGTATLQHGSASEPAAVGADVREGDRIATGPGGRLAVRFADGSTLSIGERSAVSISHFADEAAGQGGNGVLGLLAGIIRVALSRGTHWDRFEVVTDTAIASVRYTDWVVEAGPDGTAVFVVRGAVQVSGRGVAGAVLLQPGFGTDVAPGAAPTIPKRWGVARAESVLRRTRLP